MQISKILEFNCDIIYLRDLITECLARSGYTGDAYLDDDERNNSMLSMQLILNFVELLPDDIERIEIINDINLNFHRLNRFLISKNQMQERALDYKEIYADSGLSFSVGTMEILCETFKAHRCSIDFIYSAPIVRKISGAVLDFLVAVKGMDDKLICETHGHWGWHYHYCKSNRDRSDTILSFDTKSSEDTKALYWEKHGEGKAKFLARAERWADWRRESIYDACVPHLSKWPLSKFRHPAKKSNVVWPKTAALS